ncbi:MAG TPA: DnaJ domain-containing protein, partial [Blastocatellia bacterium]|nr:DnaJ domain-containing protein [Blastocatellia bacterium]
MPKSEMQKYDVKKDYYRELGVRREASAEEIDRAYRSEARKRHPDGGGSEEGMKSLNEAHDVLSDGETRKAYDQERRPAPSAYVPSMAFDPEAASKAGTLGIPVSDPDFAGLVMGAVACFGLGIPLLLLVEMQWMFFLWPLRIMSLGALGVGVYMSRSALAIKQRKLRKARHGGSRYLLVIRELLFWLIATT